MSVDYHARYAKAPASYTKQIEKRFADLPAGSTVLIPSPQDIEAVVSDLNPSATITFSELRNELAARCGADGTCPVMAGMNLRVAAEVTFEAIDAGVPAEDLTPIWKAIDPTSALASKLPCTVEALTALRAAA